MKSIPIPRFAYLFLRRPYHSRAVMSWAVLRLFGRGRPVSITRANQLLSRLFGISEKAVRDIRRHPLSKTFWEEKGGSIHPIPPTQLWELAKSESVVAGDQYVNVPVEALRRLGKMKAWIVSSVLTRGPKPCSIAYTQKMMRCSRRAVTEYRKRLTEAGVLETYAQYQDCGPLKTSGTLSDVKLPNRRQFISQGRLRQRLPDIVILRDGSGAIIDILANEEMVVKKRPRRYYSEARHVKAGATPQSLVRIHGNTWANVFSSDRGSSSTFDPIPSYSLAPLRAENVRGKERVSERPLKTSGGRK